MASRWATRHVTPDGRHDEVDDLPRLIVDEITLYMREHKVSRADLAHSMKVSPGRVSQILSGEENLTLRTLAGVLGALGAEAQFILQPLGEPFEILDAGSGADEPGRRR